MQGYLPGIANKTQRYVAIIKRSYKEIRYSGLMLRDEFIVQNQGMIESDAKPVLNDRGSSRVMPSP